MECPGGRYEPGSPLILFPSHCHAVRHFRGRRSHHELGRVRSCFRGFYPGPAEGESIRPRSGGRNGKFQLLWLFFLSFFLLVYFLLLFSRPSANEHLPHSRSGWTTLSETCWAHRLGAWNTPDTDVSIPSRHSTSGLNRRRYIRCLVSGRRWSGGR